jgi:hypothetical protein
MTLFCRDFNISIFGGKEEEGSGLFYPCGSLENIREMAGADGVELEMKAGCDM